MLLVKPCRVQTGFTYRDGFSVTDGEKWYVRAFSEQERAEKLLLHLTTPEIIRVNISYPQPLILIGKRGL